MAEPLQKQAAAVSIDYLTMSRMELEAWSNMYASRRQERIMGWRPGKTSCRIPLRDGGRLPAVHARLMRWDQGRMVAELEVVGQSGGRWVCGCPVKLGALLHINEPVVVEWAEGDALGVKTVWEGEARTVVHARLAEQARGLLARAGGEAVRWPGPLPRALAGADRARVIGIERPQLVSMMSVTELEGEGTVVPEGRLSDEDKPSLLGLLRVAFQAEILRVKFPDFAAADGWLWPLVLQREFEDRRAG